jgi:hypothetical protein
VWQFHKLYHLWFQSYARPRNDVYQFRVQTSRKASTKMLRNVDTLEVLEYCGHGVTQTRRWQVGTRRPAPSRWPPPHCPLPPCWSSTDASWPLAFQLDNFSSCSRRQRNLHQLTHVRMRLSLWNLNLIECLQNLHQTETWCCYDIAWDNCLWNWIINSMPSTIEDHLFGSD